MNRKELLRIRISLILNLFIFVLVLLGIICMVTGFQFMSDTRVLSSKGLSAFKFYTVDSNVLVGIISLLLGIYEYRLLKNKLNIIPKNIYILKFIATVSVCLTFLVTALYLVPLFGDKYLTLYKNSNLFFHFIVPILSFISFVFFEKVSISFKESFLGISTMIVYGLFYVINILTHLDNGKITHRYDWYYFANGDTSNIVIVFLIIMLFTYFISFIVWIFNKKCGGKNER